MWEDRFVTKKRLSIKWDYQSDKENSFLETQQCPPHDSRHKAEQMRCSFALTSIRLANSFSPNSPRLGQLTVCWDRMPSLPLSTIQDISFPFFFCLTFFQFICAASAGIKNLKVSSGIFLFYLAHFDVLLFSFCFRLTKSLCRVEIEILHCSMFAHWHFSFLLS